MSPYRSPPHGTVSTLHIDSHPNPRRTCSYAYTFIGCHCCVGATRVCTHRAPHLHNQQWRKLRSQACRADTLLRRPHALPSVPADARTYAQRLVVHVGRYRRLAVFLLVVLGWCLVVGCWVIRVCRCSRAVPLHPTAASAPVTRHVHAHQCPSPSNARGVDPMFPLTLQLQSGWCPGIVWRALVRAQTRAHANRRRWFVARFCHCAIFRMAIPIYIQKTCRHQTQPRTTPNTPQRPRSHLVSSQFQLIDPN